MREKLETHFAHVTPVGSRVTCNPAPTDTDQDYLILGHNADKDVDFIVRHGFDLDNPSTHYRPEENLFNSWRKGDYNVILTFDAKFHRRFLAATDVAKRLNLLDKSDRVALFQAVLYGNSTLDTHSQTD